MSLAGRGATDDGRRDDAPRLPGDAIFAFPRLRLPLLLRRFETAKALQEEGESPRSSSCWYDRGTDQSSTPPLDHLLWADPLLRRRTDRDELRSSAGRSLLLLNSAFHISRYGRGATLARRAMRRWSAAAENAQRLREETET